MPDPEPLIDFYDGNDCTQEYIGSVIPLTPLRYNLIRNHSVAHDEARSARLRFVPPGTRIRVYDDPDGEGDDWAEIEVLQLAAAVDVGSFQRSGPVNREGPPLARVTWHRGPGLDGKVARIEVDPGPVEGALPRLHRALWGAFEGWPAAGGAAWEGTCGGQRARVWRPHELALTPEGGAALALAIEAGGEAARLRATFGGDGQCQAIEVTRAPAGGEAIAARLRAGDAGDLAAALAARLADLAPGGALPAAAEAVARRLAAAAAAAFG